jgi:hypothetical protein
MTAQLGYTFTLGLETKLLATPIEAPSYAALVPYDVAYCAGLAEGIKRGFRRGVGAARSLGLGVDAAREEARDEGFHAGFAIAGGRTTTTSADVIPPDAAAVTPIGEVAADAVLVVDVTDASGLASVTVFALWDGLAKPDLVYRAGEFQADYTVGSFVEVLGTGFRLHIARDAGWPEGDVSLLYDLVDSAGNVGAA